MSKPQWSAGLLAVCLIFSDALLTEATAQSRPRRPTAPAAGRRPAPAVRSPRSRQPQGNPRIERALNEAQRAYQRGDYKYTLELLGSVLREEPKNHAAMYLRASARVEQGNRDGDADLVRLGVLDAREAIRLEDSRSAMYFLPYLFGMTRLAAIEDRDEHARVSLQIADHVLKRKGLTPQDRSHLLYQRATTNMLLEKYSEAERDFERALAQDKKHLGAALGLAEAQAEGGHQERALSSFSRAVQDFPESPLAWNNRGMYRQKLGQMQGAIADFNKAIELRPTYHVALTNRGFTRLEDNRPAEAEQDFTSSLAVQPEQPSVLTLRATSRLRQGKIRGAIEDFRLVVKDDPEVAIARADLGFALFFSRDYAAALKEFEQASTLDPQLRYLGPWQLLTRQLLGQRTDDADLIQQARSLPEDRRDWIHDLLVWLGRGLTDDELVATVSTQTAEIQQAQLCEAHFFVGMRLLQASRTDEALDHFRTAVATDRNHLSAWRGAWLTLESLQQ